MRKVEDFNSYQFYRKVVASHTVVNVILGEVKSRHRKEKSFSSSFKQEEVPTQLKFDSLEKSERTSRKEENRSEEMPSLQQVCER